MSDASLLPNTFQKFNWIVDWLGPYLTDQEYRVIDFAVRHIFGWTLTIKQRNGKSVGLREGRISLTKFVDGIEYQKRDPETREPMFDDQGAPVMAALAGTGYSKGQVLKILTALEKYRVMVKVSETEADGTPRKKTHPDGTLWHFAEPHEIDIEGLKERLEKRQEKRRKKTQKATEASMEARQASTSHVPPVTSTSHVPAASTPDVPPTGTSHVPNETHRETHTETQPPAPPSPPVDVTSDEPPAAAAAGKAEVFRAYENEIGLPSAVIVDELNDTILEYPCDWIIEAIHEAARNNVRKWSYVRAILERWKREGRNTKVNGKSNPSPRSAAPPPRPRYEYGVKEWFDADGKPDPGGLFDELGNQCRLTPEEYANFQWRKHDAQNQTAS